MRWRSRRETGYDLRMAAASRETLALVDRLMLEMIAQQEAKVLAMARQIHPGVTPEDIRNPQDFPDLVGNAVWNFEDGILAGLKSAHVALRARIIEETSTDAASNRTKRS
jgi:hypothetical protein